MLTGHYPQGAQVGSAAEQPRLPARLLADPEFIEACAHRDFGRVFTLARRRAGIYPSRIARQCDMTPGRVSDIIAGQRTVHAMSLIERIADGLRIPGHMLGLAPRDWEHEPLETSGREAAPSVVPATRGDELLGMSQAGIGGMSRPTTVADVRVIREMLVSLTAADHQFGGGHARVATTAFLRDVVAPRLHAPADRQVCRSVFAVASEFALRAAWMHLDVGDAAMSRRLMGAALGWAHEAGDMALQAWILAMRSLQETWLVQPGGALAYAAAAVAIAPHAPADVHAFVLGKQARAFAIAGDGHEAERALGQARDLFASCDEQSALTVRSGYGWAYMQDEEAHCYRDVGQHSRACEAAAQSLALRGADGFTRTRAFATSTQALALVATGEIEQACEVGLALATAASELASTRVDQRLEMLLNALTPHDGATSVRELHEAIRALPDRWRADGSTATAPM
jgi:hypothetical protein